MIVNSHTVCFFFYIFIIIITEFDQRKGKKNNKIKIKLIDYSVFLMYIVILSTHFAIEAMEFKSHRIFLGVVYGYTVWSLVNTLATKWNWIRCIRNFDRKTREYTKIKKNNNLTVFTLFLCAKYKRSNHKDILFFYNNILLADLF